MLGLSDCDSDGKVPYKEFARVCVDYIDEQMKFSTLLKKSEIMNNIKKNSCSFKTSLRWKFRGDGIVSNFQKVWS